MKIALLQMRIALGDFSQNRATVLRLVEEAMRRNPDAIVLPEMWNVGFFPKPAAAYADPDGAETRAFLSDLAKNCRVNLVGGSAAVLREDGIHNTCYIFGRGGALLSSYDKTHLFSPSGEDKIFQKGDHLSVFELDGVRCGVAICYDIRFPELIWRLALEGVAVLFVPAAWPTIRIAHWQLFARARAAENQCFVAAVNGVGAFGQFVLGGNSMLLDPWGESLAHAGAEETVAVAEIDLARLDEIRGRMNIFNDRRPELY